MIDTGKINEVVSRIVEKFNPYKIILFGSYANGYPSENSDLDLLIIQDTNLPLYKRGMDIRLSLIGTMIPIDLLIFTKSEFNEQMANSYSFINTALKNSKILYEREDGGN
jgi:uncharacterized protein